MIDRETFAREWAIMQNRFDKKFSDLVVARYYEVLSKQLSTEQFQAACLAAFTEDDFFPTPEKLIKRVQPDANQLALTAWESVLKAASNVSQGVALCAAGDRALRSVGGLSAVGYADTYTQIPHIRRNFLEAFKTYHDVVQRESLHNALPSAQEAVQHPALNGIGSIGRSM